MNLQSALNNPVVKQGLRTLSPQGLMAAEALIGVFSFLVKLPKKKRRQIHVMLELLDERAGEIIEELAKPNTQAHQQELEIRLHEILEIGQRWDRVGKTG
jgi:hypothetical protein